nr:RNA pseudouridine synthase 2, chloroplastic isoform X1 [Tanacetum cinerariifolium]
IRAHAKYLGIPLMGDDVYGGSKNMAISRLQLKNPSSLHGRLSQLVGKLERPCLHALTLGFTHPCTGEKMQFSCLPPADFAEILTGLRNISRETVKE